jgi:hypothetical protein
MAVDPSIPAGLGLQSKSRSAAATGAQVEISYWTENPGHLEICCPFYFKTRNGLQSWRGALA